MYFLVPTHAWPAEPNWIWSTPNAATKAAAGNVYFRRAFTIESPGKAAVEITADNRYDLFVNGRHVGSGKTDRSAATTAIKLSVPDIISSSAKVQLVGGK